MNNKMNNVKENGFTLMELMIVIAIISILATGTGFAIIKKMPDYHLQTASDALFLDFQLAKSNAVLHQEKTRILFNLETNSYRILRLGSDGDVGGTGAAEDTPVKEVFLANYGSGVTFGRGIAPPMTESQDNLTYTNDWATFSMNGSADELGYAYLTHINRDRCYAVGTPSNAGIIRIYRAVNRVWENR